MSTDAIVLLKNDHKEIRKAFRDFQKAGENAHATKGKLVDKMIELLTVHTYIENEVMYPRVRELLPDLEDDVLESYEEHHVADVLVVELSMMRPDDERFTAKTTVLIENVDHHIDEEEKEWFPKVREGLGRKALQELGAEILEAIEGGAMDAPYVQLKGKSMLAGEFPPAFRLAGALKDVELILVAADEAGADLGMMPAIRAHFARAVDAGHGDLDMSATFLEH
jgi:hemerythrin superfamily protein